MRRFSSAVASAVTSIMRRSGSEPYFSSSTGPMSRMKEKLLIRWVQSLVADHVGEQPQPGKQGTALERGRQDEERADEHAAGDLVDEQNHRAQEGEGENDR